jgi:dodecin
LCLFIPTYSIFPEISPHIGWSRRSRSGADLAEALIWSTIPALNLERPSRKEDCMSVAKIIEISAESPTSFEDAIVQGIGKASKTVHGIKSAWVKEQHVVIENGKVTLYRVDLKVTFVLD